MRDIDFSFLPSRLSTAVRAHQLALVRVCAQSVQTPRTRYHRPSLKSTKFLSATWPDHNVYTATECLRTLRSSAGAQCRRSRSTTTKAACIETLNIARDTQSAQRHYRQPRKAPLVPLDHAQRALRERHDSAAYNKRQVVLLAAEDIERSLRTSTTNAAPRALPIAHHQQRSTLTVLSTTTVVSRLRADIRRPA